MLPCTWPRISTEGAANGPLDASVFADDQTGDVDVALHRAVDHQFAVAGDVALEHQIGGEHGDRFRGRAAGAPSWGPCVRTAWTWGRPSGAGAGVCCGC